MAPAHALVGRTTSNPCVYVAAQYISSHCHINGSRGHFNFSVIKDLSRPRWWPRNDIISREHPAK